MDDSVTSASFVLELFATLLHIKQVLVSWNDETQHLQLIVFSHLVSFLKIRLKNIRAKIN
jgi:hypothetical protein